MGLLLMDSLGILARPCRLKTRYVHRNVLLLFKLTTCMCLQRNKQVAHSAKHAIYALYDWLNYCQARTQNSTLMKTKINSEANFIYQEITIQKNNTLLNCDVTTSLQYVLCSGHQNFRGISMENIQICLGERVFRKIGLKKEIERNWKDWSICLCWFTKQVITIYYSILYIIVYVLLYCFYLFFLLLMWLFIFLN